MMPRCEFLMTYLRFTDNTYKLTNLLCLHNHKLERPREIRASQSYSQTSSQRASTLVDHAPSRLKEAEEALFGLMHKDSKR